MALTKKKLAIFWKVCLDSALYQSVRYEPRGLVLIFWIATTILNLAVMLLRGIGIIFGWDQ